MPSASERIGSHARETRDMTPNEEPGSTSSSNFTYISALLESARDDVRHVNLLVAATLALAAVFFTQLPFERLVALPLTIKIVLLLGVALLVLSAMLFFVHMQEIQRYRRDCLRFFLWQEQGEPRDTAAERFIRERRAENQPLFGWGMGLLLGAAPLLMIVLVWLVVRP
jgi:hypothetical protein